MDAKKVLKILKKHGFEQVSQSGSHIKLKKELVTVIVPYHSSKDLKIGTLKSIEKVS